MKNKNLAIGTGVVLAFIFNAYFWSHYYVQGPIKKIEWQCVVCSGKMTPVEMPKKPTVAPKKATVEVKKPLTEEEIVKGAKNGEILWNIYMLESTRGKNDACRSKGQFGGFGVMGANGPQCYGSFQEAVNRAAYWYEKVSVGNTLDQSLCIWNQGTKMNSCHYSVTYHSL